MWLHDLQEDDLQEEISVFMSEFSPDKVWTLALRRDEIHIHQKIEFWGGQTKVGA